MALVEQIRAITHDYVSNKLADNVFLSTAGFRRLYSKRIKLDGGYDIGASLIVGGPDETTGAWYTGAETLVSAEKDDISRARVDWKQGHETILISTADLNKNSGKAQIVSLLKGKMQAAEKRFSARLATGVFNAGTTAKAFNGLQQIIGTGAYAGLASTDFTDEAAANAWQAQIKSNSGTVRALSGSLIQGAMGAATQDSESPSVAFMLQNVFDELWSILEPHQRLMVEDSSFSGLGHAQSKKVLQYNGIPFLVDSHMKANSMFFVNEEYVKFYVHQAEDMKAQRFDKLEDQNAVKERMLIMGNLLCNNRRFQAELGDINVAA